MSVNGLCAKILVAMAISIACLAPSGAVASLSQDRATTAVGQHSSARDLRPARIWYVRATAQAGGDGSSRAPFNTLAQVEARSRPDDRIVVRPSPLTVPPLDSGIALKRGQTLVGAGRSVRGAAVLSALPRLTNSDPLKDSGNAVTLASRVRVANLVIADSEQSGIYGRNVTGIRIEGNDVSGHNTACAVGFIVLPFTVPTNVPGGSISVPNGFSNGRAGIMVDESRVRGQVAFSDNYVHDAECGDGIDLRLSETARIRARFTDNLVTHLKQGPAFASILGLGMQTRGDSRLVSRMSDNRQRELGSPGANSEGVFANLNGASTMRVEIKRNTYSNAQGIGGFSSNGMEMIISGGRPRARMHIADSSFSGSPGDILVEGNLGTRSRMSLTLDHVLATRSTGLGDTGFIPFNNGDCLVTGIGGDHDSLALRIRNSRLTHCMNNGVTFAGGQFSGGDMHLRVADSRIASNRGGNLFFKNFGDLDTLSARIVNTDLSASRGDGSAVANVQFDQQGTVQSTRLDLGGGQLGSEGGNCIFGGALDAELENVHLVAKHNWWGRRSGPAPGSTVLHGSASLRFEPALPSRPPACGG